MHILIVEDDIRIGGNLHDFLESSGHQCEFASTLTEARRRLDHASPDVLVLDINLPDGDGLVFARHLRQNGRHIPVLMLTARDTLDDKLAGFAAGADDYLVKPFALREVEVRLQALCRRGRRPAEDGLWRHGPLEYDATAQELRLDGRPLRLTPKAIRLLALMLQNPNRVFARGEIELAVWGHELESSDNLRSLLHLIRKELAANPQVSIDNLHGLGYKLVVR